MNEGGRDDALSGLTDFQVTVARMFFALPASEYFLLAGGAALVAQRLSTRPTQDLDLFTRQPRDVSEARTQLEAALIAQGWSVHGITDTPTFARLLVHGPEDLIVDLAVDSAPERPATASFVGPTFAPEELAGRKLLALFDRAAPRDFVDLYALSTRFTTEQMISEASQLDAGFTPALLLGQLALLDRYADEDLPIDAARVPPLRAFIAAWRRELATELP